MIKKKLYLLVILPLFFLACKASETASSKTEKRKQSEEKATKKTEYIQNGKKYYTE